MKKIDSGILRINVVFLALVLIISLVVLPAVSADKSAQKKSGLSLSSTAFKEGERIPVRYTGDGQDVSPALFWRGAPVNTRSFALICDDPDAPAGTWDHWLVFDLPSSVFKLPEAVGKDATLENGAKQGRNSWGKVGYAGPSPPAGKPHRYFFKLYALDAPSGLKPGATKKQVLAAIKGHIIGQTELMGTYSR